MNDEQTDVQQERLAEAVLAAIESGEDFAGLEQLNPDDPREVRRMVDAAMLATAAVVRAPAPAALVAKLEQAGRAFCAERERPLPQLRPRNTWFGTGALLGFAAGVLLTLVLSLRQGDRSPTAAREQLIARANPTVVEWQPGAVEGDVVWSDERQEGYLRIRGLGPLDDEHEYQLWIVDGRREGSPPIDGGLFRLPDPGEHVVPIAPKLPVGEAKAFVVTVEKKGGVVVSAQEQVVAVAGL